MKLKTEHATIAPLRLFLLPIYQVLSDQLARAALPNFTWLGLIWFDEQRELIARRFPAKASTSSAAGQQSAERKKST